MRPRSKFREVRRWREPCKFHCADTALAGGRDVEVNEWKAKKAWSMKSRLRFFRGLLEGGGIKVLVRKRQTDVGSMVGHVWRREATSAGGVLTCAPVFLHALSHFHIFWHKCSPTATAHCVPFVIRSLGESFSVQHSMFCNHGKFWNWCQQKKNLCFFF